MLHSHFIHIDEEHRAAFGDEHLVTFDDFMRSDVGEKFMDERTRSVIRLNLGGRGAYLKRAGPDRVRKHLAILFRGARPKSAALREVALLTHLRDADIAAARPIAWGEVRRCGVPREGFIVTEAVAGESLDKVIVEAPLADRSELLERFGGLLGRLHAAGFFHIVRLKDIIVSEGRELVLIDREVAAPWPRRFSPRKCKHSLARCEAKMLRAGFQFDPTEMAHVYRGYLAELGDQWRPTEKELIAGIQPFLDDILSGHRYTNVRGDRDTDAKRVE